MRARIASLLRKAAARLDPDREYVINTVQVHIDEKQLIDTLQRYKRRGGL